MALPDTIRDVEHLEELLSEPSPAAIDAMSRLDGDLLILGVSGKMGPTMARMARRAIDAAGPSRRRVIGVARFSHAGQQTALERHGVETIACDLLDPDAVAKLPDAASIIYLAGRKFGSTGNEPLTWAVNTYLPSLVCRRYRTARLVAMSTGNVYGLTPAGHGGSREDEAPNPVGEYAMSCLGRERMFEYFSRANGTPTAILRLNYASEMRYGVLVDLAQRVRRREPIDLSMGYVNVIWQADANAMTLAALGRAASPAQIVNVAGAEELRIRETSLELGRRMNVDVSFTGTEGPDALLSNGSRGRALLGEPRVDTARLIAWTADWVNRGGATLDKPTHFESRRGDF